MTVKLSNLPRWAELEDEKPKAPSMIMLAIAKRRAEIKEYGELKRLSVQLNQQLVTGNIGEWADVESFARNIQWVYNRMNYLKSKYPNSCK
jgi:hypothetical protein